MGNGYTRQSSAQIVSGLSVLAASHNNEFNALQSAFDSSLGHAHDGATGNGPKINLTTSVSQILPIANGGTAANTAAGARNSLGANNASNLTTGTLPNARLTGAYDGITTLGTSGLITVNTTGEAIRLNAGNATSDPYISFYKTISSVDTRQGYIMHTEGTALGAGLRLYNEVPSTNSVLCIQNTGELKFYPNSTAGWQDVWHGANDGAGSGLDADLLDGQEGSFYRNASNLNAGTVSNARISGAYDGITTLGTSGRITVTTSSEAIRIASISETADPYLSFTKLISGTDTLQGWIQHKHGTSDGDGFRFANDITNDYLYLSNVNNVNAFRWYDSSITTHHTVWHSGNDGAGSGLDADLLDGLEATRFYRDNASFSTTGNFTVVNSAPIITLQDSTAGSYNGRLRVDANNLYFQTSTDDVTYTEVFRFELDTKIGYANGSRIITAAAGTAYDSARLGGTLAASFVQNTRTITAGNGLSGGGTLAADRTITLGTPLSISNSTTNSVGTADHTHALSFVAAEVYTGTSATNTSFPLGHTVNVLDSSLPPLNSTLTPRLDSVDYRYTTSGSGSTLSGTWRSRGIAASNIVMIQRTA